MNIIKLTAVLATVSALALTGCANKKPQSEVVVAPAVMGQTDGYASGSVSTGDNLTGNSDSVRQNAASLARVIYFGFDESNISSSDAAILNQHVSFLNSNPNAKVVLAGHTDERGSREYNLALGERRGKAVQSYLMANGISGDRLEVISYGEEQPAAMGSNEQAWAQNRRVELVY